MTIHEDAQTAVTIRDEDGVYWLEYGGEEYILTSVHTSTEAETIADHLRQFIAAFGLRCAEAMREECKQAASNTKDNMASMSWNHACDDIVQAIERLEVK